MKNIYSLSTTQLSKENFQLRVIYRDDQTGIDNPSLHEGSENIVNVPLVQVLGVDQLNSVSELQPDGVFDYVDGITVNSETGRVIFTTLEPFGSNMETYFDETTQLQLINKYVFDDEIMM